MRLMLGDVRHIKGGGLVEAAAGAGEEARCEVERAAEEQEASDECAELVGGLLAVVAAATGEPQRRVAGSGGG